MWLLKMKYLKTILSTRNPPNSQDLNTWIGTQFILAIYLPKSQVAASLLIISVKICKTKKLIGIASWLTVRDI